MFTLPASKVSVPVLVVILNLSRIPDVVLLPFDQVVFMFEFPPTIPLAIQVLEPINVKTSVPLDSCAAFLTLTPKAVVKFAPPRFTPSLLPDVPKYPVVSTEPEPICMYISAVLELVLTPLNITVIRFTHDGMPVKSMLVPDVLATAVPEVIPSTAPLLIVTLAEPSITVAIINPRTLC
jgi:hypothetical protein